MTAVTYTEASAASRSPAWWGTLLLIATEATLFALLLVSYFYERFEAVGPWPPDGTAEPKLLVPAVMTALLMASSVPAYLADSSIRRGEVDRLRVYLASTLVLGAAFLGLQAWEYSDELDVLRPQTDAYGSLFYTVTGLHGAHVIVGLFLLGWVLAWALRGRYGADRHLAVEISSLYWHFVHVVWLFVFLSLYLSPRL
ncbi:MAG TPA: cytochrome c oxidase subunit 3 [Gaiellaceae bacterium]|jgi:heme/copper-type cytochrome/quinol oxidase subunit 3|nr:cytochrome c oxidase subunit 3 [Gaiellaceae bacterium]